MPAAEFWSNLPRTLRNRPFRWLLLALVGAPVIAAYWTDTVQVPLASHFNWDLDGNVYLKAAATLAAGGSPYAAFHPEWSVLQGNYIYPPLLAWALQPLARLPVGQADTVLLGIGQLLFLGTFAATLAAFRVRTPWRAFVYLLLFLGFEPNWEDLFLLQVNPLLALGAALWVVAWARRSALGGAALGAGVAVKLLLGPLLALPLLRRRWADLGVALAAGAALTLVAAPGWLPDYLLRVLPSAGRGVGSVANIAPAGVAAWIVQPASLYTTPGPGSPVPTVVAALVALAVLAVTLWRLRRPAETELGRAAEAAALVATLPLVSSLAWPNYTTIVMVALVGCLEVAWARRDPLPAILAGVFWLLLGPGHILEVNQLVSHQADPSVRLAIATNTMQPGWDALFRAWALTGPLALACLWLGALRAARKAASASPELPEPVRPAAAPILARPAAAPAATR